MTVAPEIQALFAVIIVGAVIGALDYAGFVYSEWKFQRDRERQQH